MLMHEIPSPAGKTLGCWCKPSPCHGDVLVKLVKEHFEKEEFENLPDVDDIPMTSEEIEQINYSQDSKTMSMEGVTDRSNTSESTLRMCYGLFQVDG